MKFVITFLIFIFTLSAHAFVPEKAFTFDFNVRTYRMSRMKEAKMDRALNILKRVFSSSEFKRRILQHRYRGRRSFAQNRGLSNYQIYHKILDGVERLRPFRNNAMDVEIELYTDYQSTVLGYTYPRSKRIWMNSKYFNRHTPGKVAAHLVHEWLHKLGFDHDYKRTHRRKYSVPYAVGYIVRDLAKKEWAYR